VSVVERVREIVEPLLADRSLEVVDVEHRGAQLRVTVERAGRGSGDDAGVDLDDISAATVIVSRALDEHDTLPGRYTLEVSSPGLERTLRTPAHFQRAVGESVRVKVKPDVDELEGERRIDGMLTAADDDGITVDGRRVAYRHIERARTVFEWAPAPKPSRGNGKQHKSAAKSKARTP